MTLRRWREITWLPVALSALAVAFPRSAPIALAAAAFLFLVLPPLGRGHLGSPRLLLVATALFLLVCGVTVFYQPGRPFDLFEDGQILASADAYLRGGRAYVETYPIHGWGADGGVDAFLFRIFGATLETFHVRRAAMTACALVALAAAGGALFGSMAWGAAAFLAALGVCPFPHERHMLAFAALFFLLLGARCGRRPLFAVAGALGACELFYSLDLGLMVLSGGLLGVATLPLLASRLRRIGSGPRDSLAFLGGAAAASLPFVALLVRAGSLRPFLRVSFLEIPSWIGDVWGIPAGSARDVLIDPDPRQVLLAILSGPRMPSLFVLLILATATAILLLRSAQGTFERADGPAWIAVVISAAAARGFLGRADAGHLAFYGVFAGLPAAWLLYRASRSQSAPIVLTGAALFLLLPRLRPLNTLSLELGAVTGATQARAVLAKESVRLPRTGNAGLPPAQADEILALRRFFDSRLASGETFFDFGNEPGLYFLLERPMPVRFTSVPFYESSSGQEEVIARLERERPPFALLASGSGRDAFDGVSNRERAPRVAAYLDAAYEPFAEVEGRRIGRRKPGSEATSPRGP